MAAHIETGTMAPPLQLVYATLEYRIRQALKQHDQTFPQSERTADRTPTARWVLKIRLRAMVL